MSAVNPRGSLLEGAIRVVRNARNVLYNLFIITHFTGEFREIA